MLEQVQGRKPGQVTAAQSNSVRIIRIDNPPVNALSGHIRVALLEQLEAAENDAAVKAILIQGEGPGFLGGADIREFGKTRVPPVLPDLCDRIEKCDKPVIAAIHGPCLGGGLEVALAAHYRITEENARIGLPEVNLGLLPGAGGTQRTPRLIGAQAALDLMLTGRHASAREALAWGLVDRLAAGGGFDKKALAFADEIVEKGLPPRRTSTLVRAAAQAAFDAEALSAARAGLDKKSKGLFSPSKIVELVEATSRLPYSEGARLEREAYTACVASPQHGGLVHAFLSERATAKAPETRIAKSRPLHAIGVVGGGTMGAGIAVAMLDSGLEVLLVERDAAALARGLSNVGRVYDGLIAKGRLSQQKRDETLSRLRGSLEFDDLKSIDLVVEAVFEEMQVKLDVLKELDAVCRPGAIIATNTSYLDVKKMAASISRPADVIGLHFFSPANIMRLLEIVVPDGTAPDVVATAFELAKRLKKIPVRSGVGDGFIGNRILSAYRLACDYLVEDGASPYEVDAAMREFGFAMGMFQVADLAGGDIGWATRKRRAPTRDPRQRYVQISDRLCEQGWFGQKTERGYYRYEGRSGAPDPEVLAIIDTERQCAGIQPRSFTSAQIMDRVMAAMVNEGLRVLEEKIALRPLEIDVVFVHGYGFPRYRGGPMFYADTVGLEKILNDIRAFANEDDFFWKPSKLMLRLVAEGRTLDNLNKTGVE